MNFVARIILHMFTFAIASQRVHSSCVNQKSVLRETGIITILLATAINNFNCGFNSIQKKASGQISRKDSDSSITLASIKSNEDSLKLALSPLPPVTAPLGNEPQ